jgi:hypothetical protein
MVARVQHLAHMVAAEVVALALLARMALPVRAVALVVQEHLVQLRVAQSHEQEAVEAEVSILLVAQEAQAEAAQEP